MGDPWSTTLAVRSGALRCAARGWAGVRASVRAYGVCERALVDCLRACVRAGRQAGGC